MSTYYESQPPLAGIRVIDFGHYIAGPLTGMLLADQGAEVIKVDRPGKPHYESPASAVFDRGKSRITLDLKQSSDLETAKELIQSADVLIENFRPGVMDRLGLGADAMTALNPRLIYLSLPGFASTDKEKSQIRAFEGVISASVGVYTDLARRNTKPIYTPIPMGSSYGAIHGAIAVTFALYAREETGIGEVIEVPLSGAAMSGMIMVLFGVEDPPPRYKEQKKSSMYGSYKTGDDKWIFMMARGHQRNTRSLLKAVGIYDELIEAGMVDVPLYENMELDNNIPDGSRLSDEWATGIEERLVEIFRTQPAEYWVEKINAAAVPCSLQRTTQEWLHTPEAETAGLTVIVDDEEYGPMRQLGIQTQLSNTPEDYFQPKPATSVRDLSEILARWKDEKGTHAGTGEPKKQLLEGLRVIDFSNVLAGPASTRTMAEYGAEVIKIDTVNPLFGPRIHCWFPLEVSPGKRHLLLDLKEKDGLRVFKDLVLSADVLVHNFRTGVADRMGIGYDEVIKCKPDIVYMNMTALGGPRPGPWMRYPGFDPMVQGSTGIQMRYAGAGNRPLLHGWASCIDYITGYSGTLGMALSLFRRKRSGASNGGAYVQTSLAQGAQLVQAPFMYASERASSGDEPQGQDAVGEHSLHRIYKASYGALFLAGRKSEVGLIAEVPGLEDVPTAGEKDESERVEFLEGKISEQPVKYWVEAFHAAGLGCHRVDSLDDIHDNYLHEVTSDMKGEWDDGRSISVVSVPDHPAGSAVVLGPPAYAKFKNSKLKLGTPNPKFGQHTREILTELGYTQEEIDDLVRREVVKESFSEHYLPH